MRIRYVVRLSIFALVARAVIAVAPIEAQAAGVVVGSVLDNATGAPLPGVDVRVLGTSLATASRDDGTFAIDGAPAGERVLFVRRLGYAARMFPVRLSGDTTSVALQLDRTVRALPTVAIEATSPHDKLELSGFNWRRKAGAAPQSNFMTRDDIEKERPLRISDMLRRRGLSANGCNLFLDGALVARPGSVYGRAANRYASTSTIDWLGPDDIQGIEVFNRASQVPVEYNATSPEGGKAGCVVLVWTR